jgi:undecaprenyl-diphosphatase
MSDAWLAVLVGVVQGVLEWLPVSSEGAVALLGALVGGFSPAVAVQFGLFLHFGTAISAMAYYRAEIVALLGDLRTWRPRRAFSTETADLSFLVLATLATGVTGIPALLALEDILTEFEGAAFVALIGGLLVVTGLVQRFAASISLGDRAFPNWVDALVVGGLQGFTILPGISRSGTTVSVLLLRGHEGAASLRLSFLLSIPASLAAATIVLLKDGVPAIDPLAGLLALAISAVVGYLAVDTLVRVVRRIPFWSVCVGFGALAVVGGGVVALA